VALKITLLRTERVTPTGPEIEMIAAERPRGVFSRQVIFGDSLDVDHINASYQAGVLRLSIPVAPKAKARKITISSGDNHQNAIAANRDQHNTVNA
jgi:HSP20 family protein